MIDVIAMATEMLPPNEKQWGFCSFPALLDVAPGVPGLPVYSPFVEWLNQVFEIWFSQMLTVKTLIEHE